MTSVWTYPWTFTVDAIDDELAVLADAGVDGLTVAGHYHSVQTLAPTGLGAADGRGTRTNPRDGAERSLFESYPGGCHFTPDPAYFEDTDVRPPVNDSGTDEYDAFGLVADAAADTGLEANAWTVCLHNSRLGAENPDYRIESAFGDGHDHALCPSRPAVLAYYDGIVRSLCDYGVARIDLESIGFPNVLHGHGDRFGHLKNHVVSSDVGQLLLSQCFCDGCRVAAADHEVDFDAARSLVRDLLQDILRGTAVEPLSVTDLVARHRELGSLFSFRGSVVERFVGRLDAASGTVPLHYYLADGLGYVPSAVEPAGVRLGRLSDHLDGVTAICYTNSPDTVRERIQQARTVFDGPVHAGVTLDPDIVGSEAEFRAVARAARAAATGDLDVYNYSLMGDEQVAWLAAVA